MGHYAIELDESHVVSAATSAAYNVFLRVECVRDVAYRRPLDLFYM